MMSVQRSAYSVQGKTKIAGTIFFLLLSLSAAYAQPVSSTELINNAKLYDGKKVVYEGEVIGDVMARGRYSWVNLNDGQNAVGIWVPEALARDVRMTGSYKTKGDWLEATGIFHRACPEHGGDLDIHAQAIRVIQGGRVTVERANPAKKNLFFTLLGIICLIVILRQFKRP